MATIENPPNSIWPNGLKTDSEGYVTFYPLGTNKIDISTVTWPTGDKLISPFVYDENDKLVGFVDTKSLTVSENTTIYLSYTHIETEFSAIDKGQLQIHAPKATTKKASWKGSEVEDIPEVQFKYKGCTTVDNIKTVDANYLTTDIVDGVWSEPLWDLEQGSNGTTNGGMFYNCRNLTSFCGDLPNLTNSDYMFSECRYLESFSSDLSNLTRGHYMFQNCCKLTSFSSDLSSLTDGYYMFYGCADLSTFNDDLSSLTDGNGMFSQCLSLTSFSSDLSSLTRAGNMFDYCMLDAPSVKNIIDTINTCSGYFRFGIGCDSTTEDRDLFAQEVGYADFSSLLAPLVAKGWYIEVQFNGRPTTTYTLKKTSTDILPVFVKLEETEEHADYTLMDGSKKYRLNWFHETTGSTEGYTQFGSLEEAIETLNIKRIERN